MYFPTSGVKVFPLVPVVASLGISMITSMGGVSGAFVLLPFQVSVLGFSGPAVTPTNHLFNVIGIPSSVYRYIREGRMLWPLALIIILGTVPGVVVGSLARIYLLPDPRDFKLFMAGVLLLIGLRLVTKVLGDRPGGAEGGGAGGRLEVRTLRFDIARLEYEYSGQIHSVSTPAVLGLTAVIGVIGGAYGVGGGAIIAPFLVSVFDLPIHTIAGATLSGTCVTSLVGVLFFSVFPRVLGIPGVTPDWLLGGLFGLGGLGGMYTGARLQRRMPARAIEGLLGLVVTGLAVSYLVGYFLGTG